MSSVWKAASSTCRSLRRKFIYYRLKSSVTLRSVDTYRRIAWPSFAGSSSPRRGLTAWSWRWSTYYFSKHWELFTVGVVTTFQTEMTASSLKICCFVVAFIVAFLFVVVRTCCKTQTKSTKSCQEDIKSYVLTISVQHTRRHFTFKKNI